MKKRCTKCGLAYYDKHSKRLCLRGSIKLKGPAPDPELVKQLKSVQKDLENPARLSKKLAKVRLA
jgi:hypothetical protein